MVKSNPLKKVYGSEKNPFAKLSAVALKEAKHEIDHIYGNRCRCVTDKIGHKSPENHDPAKLVVDASEGFVPLWKKGVTLRWCFHEPSFIQFQNPAAAKDAIRALMSSGLLAWKDAVPIKFTEKSDVWDFRVVVKESPDCDDGGCVLASAFFPDQGRHELVIYPTLFEQSAAEQTETLAHEFGHVFGLRHFFANISETAWASEVFGSQSKFTIMNYGPDSKMTSKDRSDLKKLYKKVWSGELDEINGTPIRLVKPFHEI